MGIAVLGGTFDPVHLGHLIIAEQAYNNFDLEKVIFMPAYSPPHKDEAGITETGHRLEMTRLALEDNSHFEYSEREISRAGRSYTVDTLKEMQEDYPDQKIYFLIGADSLLDIYSWKEPRYLLENANFITARRPDFSLKEIFLDERFRPYRDNIELLDNSLVDISSSQIRRLYRAGKSIKYLVLPVIEKYIGDNRLYC